MLQAFRFGTPPHGGCAQGFERLLMAHFNEEYLREVQAFPQTGRGRTSVMDAPSPLEPNQLKELGLTLIETNLSSNTSLFDRILAKLAALNIKYDLLEHAPVYTSEEAVKVRPGLTLEQGAKALLMYADKTPILLVISAAKKVDLKLVKKQFGIKDLRMATKEEVIAITSVGIGAVPPTGSLFKTQTYVDQSLSTNSQIVFNAGKHDRSVAMSYQDFLRFEQPELGQFAAS
jgi:prolyl-tRNA editing enzyme YbaK/EbsC (Cys-tRNA(Pro) deacylase)